MHLWSDTGVLLGVPRTLREEIESALLPSVQLSYKYMKRRDLSLPPLPFNPFISSS